MDSSTPPHLSIIIPAYNESRRLGATLSRIDRYIGLSATRCELIVVDDGSSDDTAGVARHFEARHMAVRVLSNDGNMGKGYSVRRGMLEAAGELLLLCDADLSTPIDQIEKLQPFLTADCDVVIGSRDMADSVLDPPQPLLRHALSTVMRTVRRCIMLRDLKDTQCGFKLFTRQAGRDIFSRLTLHGFAFDLEALALARKLGYGIKEVAVIWQDDRDSRVRPLRDGATALVCLVLIPFRLRGVTRSR